ncbi:MULTISPECIES: DUF4129 domain-containing protein [Mycobacterium]|jgi:hypothetical protein|uniref:Protein-glutamine gamma-glutamyltransferase-like C-terminal domain-containing protein n=1 Tax=Mycobacterium gordonae TaxID=1778 RepID=A0A1A6BEM5_MYCGO|nr:MULTISPECIES: DUF4129 domain-containing protein [Mycobacterium]MBI2699008.1 DUF4129 domain-containing protein [Mycobacterium sp.]MCQ4363797.1 DUF4129 domain-containing protein [Mycobacterium gordonae]MCV7009205.1 DUF4129 domain-containing protein [Mycobacterium gordonae]OBS00842.1 hypothetical protein A9W98_23030 [Mycobacterium gordonae]ODR18785.1 hypothetical protein BHQ23_21745 [Mycobacterium gordonae]
MSDKPTTRVVALVALLMLVAAALRGYLPAHHGRRLAEEGPSKTALMFLVAAIAAALALLAFSIIARLRDPRTAAPSAGALPDMLGGGSARPSWRVVLIALGVVVAWILVAMLVSRLFSPPQLALDAPQTNSGANPSGSGGAPQPAQPPRPKGAPDMLGSLLAFVPVLLMLFVGGFIVSRRRRHPAIAATHADDPAQSPQPEATSESLVRAAEVGLAEMTDLSREPREAIIACYAAMERELANVPGAVPQEFDTPTEVLARAVEQRALRAENAVQLVNLFEEARFSPHVMDEGHRETAVRVLELVLGEIAPRSGRAA